MLVLGADAHRMYLWKPSGLPVFPPHADPAGDCLLARFRAVEPGRAAGWPVGFEGGIAHRLDTATSGLVVVARAPADLDPLRAQFAGGELRKFYLTRSEALPEFDTRVCTDPIAHHPNRKDRMLVRRGPRTAHRGRWYPAWTRFERRAAGGLEVEIRTGVMHQIRVHAAAVGVPITGDLLYGGAPGVFLLHHLRMAGPGWVSPDAPLPVGGPDALVRP